MHRNTTGGRNSETGFIIIVTYQNRNSIYWILIPINDSELRLTGAGGFIIFLEGPENAFLLLMIVLRPGRTLKSEFVCFSITGYQARVENVTGAPRRCPEYMVGYKLL